MGDIFAFMVARLFIRLAESCQEIRGVKLLNSYSVPLTVSTRILICRSRCRNTTHGALK